ncbi:MAG: hypothetical protein LBV78_14715, partial [Kitasatospora sp.]|nr:hypothetical protein [Kitasatospora sp.]
MSAQKQGSGQASPHGGNRPRGQAVQNQADKNPAAALDRPARLVAEWGPTAARLLAEWGPTAARLLLGLVLAWFGYHELVQPALWTGYV